MSNKVENLSYQRTTLYQTDYFEVVSIEWSNQSISPFHDHGWSQCSVLIEEGTFEDQLDLGTKKELRVLEVGQVIHTPMGAKHEIRCLSPRGKTVHVYTPKMVQHAEIRNFHFPSLEKIRKDLTLSEPIRWDSLQKIMGSIRNHSITTHSPFFMNQLFSGVSPQMLLAEELIAQTKTTLATQEASSVFSVIEAEVVEALGKQVGWPEGSRDGVGVPGGSAANFMAIHCARQLKFPEAKKKGISGAEVKIFVSSDAHYSFKKAAAALGIGTDSIVLVPVDDYGLMVSSELDRFISLAKKEGATPLMVCATAGTTVKGAFDPIDELAEVCDKYGVWLHVDGAWGGPALFSKNLSTSMKGIELADSFTFDAHKLFGASLTCSFFLTKHKDLLLEANDVSGGDYLFHSEDQGVDRGKLSWQCGRRADAVSFWTIWKSLGTDGLGQFVDRLLAIRDEALVWIKNQPRLELVSEPEYLNLCVRVNPPEMNTDKSEWSKKVREELKKKNLAMVNYSSDENGSFLRMILAHPHLEVTHVTQILEWALEVK